MKNTVSFETARRLKEAGFPQPEPEAGQFWYIDKLGILGEKYPPYIVNFAGVYDIYFSSVGVPYSERAHVGNRLKKEMFKQAGIFAPTATDILMELPSKWSLRHYDLEGEPVFSCAARGNDLYMNANPAEAAAFVWLAINEKQ